MVAAIFLIGAGLAIREARNERQRAEREEHLVDQTAPGHRRSVLTAFIVVFVAEWGDLTQVLTANRPRACIPRFQ